jgi:DNA-binding transcriptional ArsR family regulator
MKLIVKKTPGELYSVFSSLLFACNIEHFRNQINEQWFMKINQELIGEIEQIKNHEGFDFEEAKLFFNIQLNTQNLFVDSELLWSSKSLDEYFNQLKNQSSTMMRKKLIEGLNLNHKPDLTPQDISFYEDGNIDLQIILSLLKNQPIEKELKWNLLCLIEDPKAYIDRFIKFIRGYLPLYNEIRNKYKKKYEDFILWIEDKIETYGFDYINKNFKIMNFKEFEKIYLSYSIFDLSSTFLDLEDNQCYLYLGLLFKEYVSQTLDKKDIEKHLVVFKNFSDKTRFEIIKILIKKESFGQEIAEKLDISTATVSYHMDYLLGASLVQLTKVGRKVFYKIDKNQIRDSISFLEQELKL